MQILSIRLFEGRNIWSMNQVLQARLRLSAREQDPTNEIPGFTEGLLALLPGLAEHNCCRGHRGGFLERLGDGTYLGHVVEHVALELQTAAGYPVSYGKTMGGNAPDTWDLVISFQTPALGRAALENAVALVSAVLDRQGFDAAAAIRRPAALGDATCEGPSTASILEACRRREIPVLPLGAGGLFQLSYGCRRQLLQATQTGQTPVIAVDLCCDKGNTKQLLEAAALPVPRGDQVSSQEEARAAAAALNYPVAVKPCRGNQGKAVSLDLTTPQQVAAAFRLAQQHDERVLVEESIRGRHYRLLVIGGRLAAASERFFRLAVFGHDPRRLKPG